MSNSVSTAQQGKQKMQKHPEGITPYSKKQVEFNQGTMNMLDEARSSVENALGQGQDINPIVYQMLGLQPQYEDNTAALGEAKGNFDAAQKQYNDAQQIVSTIKGIPPGKRSKQQKQQLKRANKALPGLNTALGNTREAFGALQTGKKSITGLTKLDASQIPKESPFSALNPLNQAQATEAGRLNEYLAGGEVDPTLKHQYDGAESALRAKLAQRYGPDFENTSVGQMALQNFSRQKNEAFATYNQQQVEKYNNLAFQGQANLQALLENRIGMLQQPGQNQINEANALGNTAQQRLAQQQTTNQWNLGHGGVSASAGLANPGAALGSSAAGGLGKLLTTPYNQQGNTVGGNLSNWASGLFAPGASGALSGSALGEAAAGGVGAGMSAEGVGAGMSAAGGGEIAGGAAALL